MNYLYGIISTKCLRANLLIILHTRKFVYVKKFYYSEVKTYKLVLIGFWLT